VADPPKPVDDEKTHPGKTSVDTTPPWGAPGGQASGTIRMDARDILAAAFQQQKQRGSLLCIAGTNADLGMHLVVEDQVQIGREPPCGLQLHDGGISRAHAAVERRGTSYVLRDLGSTNGTLVNGVRLVGEHELQEGDKIHLSQSVLKFTLVDETEAVYLRQVDQLVGTDDLTGLLSKHRFDAILKEAIRTALAARVPLSAMMMDMDGLKAVNDRHGHHAGAETIRQVGGIIGRILAGRGEACRFGGDEFSAFVTGADLAAATEVAERIRREVEELRVLWQGSQLIVSISIGIVTLSPAVPEAAALLHLADQALYRAKASGKNRVCT
jgi:two-component system, cell cycle response regulator